MFCKLWQLIHPLYHQYTNSAKLCNKKSTYKLLIAFFEFYVVKLVSLQNFRLPDLKQPNQSSNRSRRVEDSSERKKRYKEKIKSLEEKLDSFYDHNRLEISESQLHKNIESLKKQKEEDSNRKFKFRTKKIKY
ncbi:hypothetical protein BpHYR1_041613 [Brachionus plicatilis]|uniref:Uncharacterized protein n=1 Tax=Brachionus plicatilis TaxID=10195 RepID=A0A3M7PQW0_BRAPC|nr:hypothetical protein BpHYR1_041613 [Brachionus plicatilis]